MALARLTFGAAGICVAVVVIAVTAHAQTLSGSALVNALRRGGYVIVMRHASSPRDVPAAGAANPDNTSRERQLDAAGRMAASEMGQALRRLMIPISEVFTSPTYRARETVRLLDVGNATAVDELGDGGRSMQNASEAQSAWLKKIVTRIPTGNSLVVTHMPNIARAFPDVGELSDGESLIFRPDGRGGVRLAARVTIEQWPHLQ
jgi:phosphohistidine phosphatase SixA